MMSFWDRFESKQDGIEDTIEFTIRLAVTTLAMVILVVVAAMVAGMFVSNDVVDSDKVFEIIGPAFNTIVGAFVGLLGGLSLNANARDAKPNEPTEPETPAPVDDSPLTATPVAANETFFTNSKEEVELTEEVADDDDDDDMAPWEKYRNDLRYDANGDGVVDENDFPDWRSAGK
jgi:hypothetical protein